MNKIKVALCMRGAVSKTSGAFSCKNDLYSNAEYVDYNACYNSIKKHIIDSNASNFSIDVFCHGWNVDLETDIVSKYKPVKYKFENNSNYNDDILKLCKYETDFGGISQALAFKKAIELKEEYETENNLQYDIVILYRYDVLLWKDMNLNEYTNLHDTIYVNAHHDGNGDFHFVMSNHKSSVFKNLIHSINSGNNCIVHFWIKNYILNYMNTNMKTDSIAPGLHQEAIRKIYEYSIAPNHLSIEAFNSYK
jgi:hypothetical protein